MNRLVSWVASRLRGESFEIDAAVPSAYLIGFTVEKVVARLRGIIKFRRLTPAAFVGAGAQIRCVSKIKLAGFANFARDSYVDALSRDGIVLGCAFSLGRGAAIECTGSLKTLGKGFVAGANVGIGSSSFVGCAGGVSIGSDTIIGNFVSLHSENHNYGDPDVPIRLQGVNHTGITIGRNCWLGAKCTILDGVSLGDGTIVAAGAVVLAGAYEPFSILAGVPARRVKGVL